MAQGKYTIHNDRAVKKDFSLSSGKDQVDFDLPVKELAAKVKKFCKNTNR